MQEKEGEEKGIRKGEGRAGKRAGNGREQRGRKEKTGGVYF